MISELKQLKKTIPALSDLRLANIRFSDALSSTLGHWDEERRCISLSTDLLKDATFETILFVFKHELAHQIVTELFEIKNAQAHGEAFKRACKLLGISSEHKISLQSMHEKSQFVSRVQKLLALSNSTNKHESELALQKAHEIALKHNIEIRDKNESTNYLMRLFPPAYKRVPSYIWGIAGIIDEFYFCQYICRPYMDPEQQRYQMLEFYGTAENLDMADYIFNFLRDEGNRLWEQYKKEEKFKNNRMKLSFLNGLYLGFSETLEKQRQTLSSTKALIWLGDPKLNEFYRQRNPYVRNSKVKNQLNSTVHNHGMIKGKELKIQTVIHDRSSTRKLLN
ncbi:MAG: DUF2786 domain-containing protein [Lentisphaeria bacterium]|nr:SprT-like domain-containing protein [Lentisphaeria bacterium]NQZ68472.1 DUF2786 domain-containing protein [Lentisphaeria bacterium]